MNNNSSQEYSLFISQSQTSIHSLLDLIRQQDSNYYNLLNVPPPAASYIPRSMSNLLPRNRRNSWHSWYSRGERPNSNFMGTHRSSAISYPSNSNDNLVFRNINTTIPPRTANIDNSEENIQPSALEIIRATDCKIYSSIDNPVNNTCPISQDEFTSDQEVIQIKYCGHIFKNQSLLTWFMNRPTCPYCRYDIRTFSLSETSNNLDDEPTQDTSINDDTSDLSGNILDDNTSIAQTISNTINTLLEEEYLDQSERDGIRSRDREFHFTVYGQRL